jgi:hypothetical protein
MAIDGDKAMEFLRRIAFPRLGGSDAEKKAAEMIAAELRGMGLKPQIEEFEIWSFANPQARVEVVEPYKATIEASALGSERDHAPRRHRGPTQVCGNGRG